MANSGPSPASTRRISAIHPGTRFEVPVEAFAIIGPETVGSVHRGDPRNRSASTGNIAARASEDATESAFPTAAVSRFPRPCRPTISLEKDETKMHYNTRGVMGTGLLQICRSFVRASYNYRGEHATVHSATVWPLIIRGRGRTRSFERGNRDYRQCRRSTTPAQNGGSRSLEHSRQGLAVVPECTGGIGQPADSPGRHRRTAERTDPARFEPPRVEHKSTDPRPISVRHCRTAWRRVFLCLHLYTPLNPQDPGGDGPFAERGSVGRSGRNSKLHTE